MGLNSGMFRLCIGAFLTVESEFWVNGDGGGTLGRSDLLPDTGEIEREKNLGNLFLLPSSVPPSKTKVCPITATVTHRFTVADFNLQSLH